MVNYCTDLGLSANKLKIGKIELNSSKVFDATNKGFENNDTQVHFREPGSTDAEDLEAEVERSIRWSYTFEMPNTNPPTSNLIEFEKLQLAKGRMYSNYAFYFGATRKIQSNFLN